MRYVYAPSHSTAEYIKQVSEHLGHQFYADFTNGVGYHKPQKITVETRMDAQIYVTNACVKQWYPIADLWAYGTPQCITCS